MKFIHITDIHLVSGDGLLNGSVPSERLEKCLDDILKWHLDAEFRARTRITTTSSTFMATMAGCAGSNTDRHKNYNLFAINLFGDRRYATTFALDQIQLKMR